MPYHKLPGWGLQYNQSFIHVYVLVEYSSRLKLKSGPLADVCRRAVKPGLRWSGFGLPGAWPKPVGKF